MASQRCSSTETALSNSRRTHPFARLCALVILLSVLPLLSEAAAARFRIILKDGAVIEAKDKFSQKGSLALVRLPNGTLTSIPLEYIDLPATEQANVTPKEPTVPSETTAPETPRRTVVPMEIPARQVLPKNTARRSEVSTAASPGLVPTSSMPSTVPSKEKLAPDTTSPSPQLKTEQSVSSPLVGLSIVSVIALLAVLGVYVKTRREREAFRSALAQAKTDLETEAENSAKARADFSSALRAEAESSAKAKEEFQSIYRDARNALDAETRRWTDAYSALKAERDRLARYDGVADADERADELRRIAEALLAKAKADAAEEQRQAALKAEQALAQARTEADRTVSVARADAKRTSEKARSTLDHATQQAETIVIAANRRAEEIAGSAYHALQNASFYEMTATAMKNVIEGYGDQYLVPTHSLLDDLADDVGYDEAGQELKKARERSKLMVKNGTAATCDYVEPERRKTAVNFIADAFNGKVDSILAGLTSNNAGTLIQAVKDAFALVNYLGKAFRDARVSEEYLNARLDELKWAAVAQQIRRDEREEQRRIKEEIREEAKARREYERAVREAERAEEAIKQAMEKTQALIQAAIEEQKTKYDAERAEIIEKLGAENAELSERLKAEEEKRQRAKSMAEQTRKGRVYVISNIGSFGENVFKIGLTRRLVPQDRIDELGDSSVPFDFDVHAFIKSDDAPALESKLHKHFLLFQVNKVDHRKEFFRVDLKHIREEIEALGVKTDWTMTAAAEEYFKTLAIEKAIEKDPADREKWVRRQLVLEDREGPPSDEMEAEAAH